MLFWGLATLNMLALLFLGGPATALVGVCYTLSIFLIARFVAKNGYVPLSKSDK